MKGKIDNIRRIPNNVGSDIILFQDYNSEKYTSFLYPVLAGITNPSPEYSVCRTQEDPCNPYMYVMEYVTDGVGYIINEGVRYKVQAGDFYMLNRNTLPFYFSDEKTPFRKKWVNVCGRFIDGLCLTFGLSDPVIVEHMDVESEIDSIHSFLSDYRPTVDPNVDIKLMRVFLELFYKVRNKRIQKQTERETGGFKQISEYVSENITYAGLSRSYLSAYFFISNRSLDRIFQKNTGMSPAKYILTKKIEYAQEILLGNNYSIEQIAELLGFTSSATFRRAFSVQCGKSPAKWKKDRIAEQNCK